MNAKKTISRFAKKKKIKSIASRFASIAVWFFGICLLYLCVSNLYQQMFSETGYTGFFGIGKAVVASSSMEPQLYPNDMVFYKEADPTSITIGDVVVYERANSSGSDVMIIHKVEKIQDGYVTTKGINNTMSDEPFPIDDVIGKYMFKIGKIGVILNLLSTGWAPILILLFLVGITFARVGTYYLNRKKSLATIAADNDTQDAIDSFFDIE